MMRKGRSADAPIGGPGPISLETKYLHLRQAVPLGHRIDGLAGLLAGRLG